MDICITIDSDWALPEVTKQCLKLLEDINVSYTFFSTRDQLRYTMDAGELAWHPDFTRNDPITELYGLQQIFPSVQGLRSHRFYRPRTLCASTLIDFGLKWVSEGHQPNAHDPIYWNNLYNFPVNWGDNLLFMHGIEPDINLITSNTSGFYVINFHPIHVFLNTFSYEQYNKYKTCTRDIKKLNALRDNKKRGVSKIFLEILELKSLPGCRFLSLSDAYNEYVNLNYQNNQTQITMGEARSDE